MLTSQDVAADGFRRTKWREGYDQGEVRAFLERVRETLAGIETRRPASTPVTAADVVAARLTPTKFREGFDQVDVDDFLEEVAQTLRQYEQ